MACSFNCSCPERKKPIAERNWIVLQRCWNSSPFEIAGGVRSDYSTVRCLSCGDIGRTKAAYVKLLKDISF